MNISMEPLSAWALVVPRRKYRGCNYRIRGGDWRPYIYWTRRAAKCAQEAYPESIIVRVVVNKVYE